MINTRLLVKWFIMPVNLAVLSTIFFEKAHSFCQLVYCSGCCNCTDELNSILTFYGFPFIYRTNMTFPYSLSGELYVLGFLGNVVVWMFIIALLMKVIHTFWQVHCRAYFSHPKYVTLWYILLGVSMIFLSIFNISYFSTGLFDWEYKWHYQNTVNLYIGQTDCS